MFSRMGRQSIRFTPFHIAGALLLLAGLVLAVYHGLEQFGLVSRFGWTSWSHIHFVTIGGFTQLLFGMLPQLTARKLDRPLPSKWYDWMNFVGLNGGFMLLWYGRGGGHTWAFDGGLYLIWLIVAGLLVFLLKMIMQSDRAWNATSGLYLVSIFVFLWGITYAYGLFAHVWQVPGGWLGLREAHVHANAWGFLGLAAIGTLYDLFPRVLDTELYSERLKNYSAWFFVAGIFPLITGPWLGRGRTVTATGLVLFATGFVLYLYNLIRTYRATESRSGIATSLLAAQFWMLGPAGFAPFVLFGVEWVSPAFIEDGALHFFFMGWALPIAFAGLLLYFRNLPCIREGRLGLAERVDPTDLFPDGAVPSVISTWMIWVWNLAILVVGVGFFYQDQAWSAYLFGSGYTVLVLLWLYMLIQVFRVRRSLRDRAGATTELNP
jgi:cytochrome c oxidase cbb3-type subunit 1